MTDLIVENIAKQLGKQQVLKRASFTAEKGKIVALLGASGSGKTTLLRCIAGLETPEQGHISIAGNVAFDSGKSINLATEQRNIGLVFQSYALWPHKTVFDNVAYGLALRKTASGDIKTRVQSILERMGLGALADRYPSQLSGGQQQRVAICRALVYEPRLLLLDEPLSNLDAKLREEARFWIRQLILDLQICAIIVTHDQTEALAIADRILLLKDGMIIQEGSPQEIYGSPTSYYSASFLGVNNIVPGKITAADAQSATLAGDGWSLQGQVIDNAAGLSVGAPARSVMRVEGLSVHESEQPHSLKMAIDGLMYLGDHWEYRLSVGDLKIRARGSASTQADHVWCRFDPGSVWIFPNA